MVREVIGRTYDPAPEKRGESHMPVPVPDVLDKLGRAGDEGVSLADVRSVESELDLCRAWGFRFETGSDRIYLLRNRDDLLPAWIEAETPSIVWERLRVMGYFQAGSTNRIALEEAGAGARAGLVVYAESQTEGRGRKGRRWLSVPGAGLCFSLLVRPDPPVEHWVLLSHVAAVALARALEELSGEGIIPAPLAIDLKWPNDVLLSGKKAAGILLEIHRSNGTAAAAVIGVGINAAKGSVVEELSDRATSVSEQAGAAVPRRWLLVRFLYHFQVEYDLFQRFENAAILDHWKSYSSMWEGFPVWVLDEDRARPAVTCGLTDLGALCIRNPDGSEEILTAADVSLRRLEENRVRL